MDALLTIIDISLTCLLPFLLFTPIRSFGPIIGKLLGTIANPTILADNLTTIATYSFDTIHWSDPDPNNTFLQNTIRFLLKGFINLLYVVMRIIHIPLAILAVLGATVLTVWDHIMNPRIGDLFFNLASLTDTKKQNIASRYLLNPLSQGFMFLANGFTPSKTMTEFCENHHIQPNCMKRPGVGLVLDVIKTGLVFICYVLEYLFIDLLKNSVSSFIHRIKQSVRDTFHTKEEVDTKEHTTQLDFMHKATLEKLVMFMDIQPPKETQFTSFLNPPKTKIPDGLPPDPENTLASQMSS